MSHTIRYAFDDDTTGDDFGTVNDGELFEDAPRTSRIGLPRAFRNVQNRARNQACQPHRGRMSASRQASLRRSCRLSRRLLRPITKRRCARCLRLNESALTCANTRR